MLLVCGSSSKRGFNFIFEMIFVQRQEFESLWIEINHDPYKNILCTVIYRHPTGKTEDFNKYLFSTLEKHSKTTKLCLFKGDFNIIADVESIHWDSVFRENDINQMFNSFYSVVNTTIDKHASLKKFSKRGTKF